MIDLLYNFELSSRHTKVQASALQTFADVLNVDHKKTSVTDVLPSGQCFKRCTAKDNADVTRSLPANGCIHACMDKPFVD